MDDSDLPPQPDNFSENCYNRRIVKLLSFISLLRPIPDCPSAPRRFGCGWRPLGIFGGIALQACLTAALATAAATAELRVRELRCDYRDNPLGIDEPQPRLSWVLESGQRGQKQTAYQVLVASSPERLARSQGDLWDSGKIASPQQNQIPYAGKPLSSHQGCWWQVRVWDKDGAATQWSAPATWTMGLLQPSDWSARWIGQPGREAGAKEGPLPLFRREFQVIRPVQRALISICGLGFYELRLNGRNVGDHVLDPGWTDYRQSCLYATYDVTEQVVRGANALGVLLGNGMYHVAGGRYRKFTGSFGPPKMILHLRLEFADGTAARIVSDDSWRTAPGPIEFSCIYGGEDCDARREQPGWDRPGFNDSEWKAAMAVEGPGGRLVSQSAPPLKIMKVFQPVKVTEPRPGVFVYDLGQNFSGWPQVQVRGPAGSSVKLVPGELLDTNGLVSQRSSGGPVSFRYTLRGGGVEVWHPRFTYYGFRYVQVEGATRAPAEAASKPLLEALEGHFIHSSARTVGEFSCSDPLLNRIHDLIDRAIESNLQSVLTDCPHREKLGWLEVSHLLGPAILFNYDAPTLYRKICRDMSEAQLPTGLVPDIAPEYTVFSGGFRDSPEWGSACVINPWLLYQRYGDRQALATHYGMMTRYVAYLASQAKDHIVAHGLGDWYDIGPGAPGESKLTTKGLTATAIYYHDLTILRRTAELLGKTEDAARYAALARDVHAAFNQQFFRRDANVYDRGSQTANAMPLVFGLVEPDHRAAVLENLVSDVRAHGNHVTAGDVGFRYVLLALAQGGRSDVIWDMNTRLDPPSYGSQLERGATTLTEAWDANPNSSQNHCMLGHAEEWFYTGLGGLQPDPEKPGFEHVIIRPQPVGGLAWARARYDSIRGRITTEWERQAGGFSLRVTVPPNATATLYLPAGSPELPVLENGQPVQHAPGVKFIRRDGPAAVFELESGAYRFSTQPAR